MRIAIDVRALMEGRHSGVEEYTIQLINAFLRVAPEHTYHLFYNAWRPVQLPEFAGPVAVHAFRFPNKAFNTLQLITGQPTWDSLLSADVFFVPSLRLLPLKPSTPLVTTVHDLSFIRFPELFSWRRRVWHRLIQPQRLMRASHRLIAVSAATAGELRRFYKIASDKITVIHSGVAIQEASLEDEQAARTQYQLPARYILYFGAKEPRKNIPTIIRAFAALAPQLPHDLVIAGSQGWLMRDIDKMVAESRLESRIHMLGFIPEKDKAALYRGAELFVYPSLYEGFGFPPLEALLAGTPVITSLNASLPEIVGPWAHLIDPYDTAELALVMKDVLQSQQPISTEVRQNIKALYSWDTAARATLDVIEAAAQLQPHPS